MTDEIDKLARLIQRLDEWARRSKSGYYDEAQDDVLEILRPFRSKP